MKYNSVSANSGCLRAPQAPKAPPLQRLDLASRHLANLYVRNLGALANDQLRALFQARRPPARGSLPGCG